MTKANALQGFKETYLPIIRQLYEQDGIPDIPVRREAWNNFVDALAKEVKKGWWANNRSRLVK